MKTINSVLALTFQSVGHPTSRFFDANVSIYIAGNKICLAADNPAALDAQLNRLYNVGFVSADGIPMDYSPGRDTSVAVNTYAAPFSRGLRVVAKNQFAGQRFNGETRQSAIQARMDEIQAKHFPKCEAGNPKQGKVYQFVFSGDYTEE
jgi:hypothetical protein